MNSFDRAESSQENRAGRGGGTRLLHMTTTYIYQGGKLRPTQQYRIDEWKAKLTEGEAVRVSFDRVEEKRSGAQNRELHRLLQAYRDATGYSLDAAKDEMLCLYGDAIEARKYLKDPPKWWRAAVPCEHKGSIWMRRSSTDYSVSELAALLDLIAPAVIEAGGHI